MISKEQVERLVCAFERGADALQKSALALDTLAFGYDKDDDHWQPSLPSLLAKIATAHDLMANGDSFTSMKSVVEFGQYMQGIRDALLSIAESIDNNENRAT
jgi:hypothetical protein